MNKDTLRKLYNSHEARCCKCNCRLISAQPLGSVFVLDISGQFYCTKCDVIFDDVDERIFDINLYEEE